MSEAGAWEGRLEEIAKAMWDACPVGQLTLTGEWHQQFGIEREYWLAMAEGILKAQLLTEQKIPALETALGEQANKYEEQCRYSATIEMALRTRNERITALEAALRERHTCKKCGAAESC